MHNLQLQQQNHHHHHSHHRSQQQQQQYHHQQQQNEFNIEPDFDDLWLTSQCPPSSSSSALNYNFNTSTDPNDISIYLSESYKTPSTSSLLSSSSSTPGFNHFQLDDVGAMLSYLDRNCDVTSATKMACNINMDNNNNNNLNTSNNSDNVTSSYQNLNFSTEMSPVIPSTTIYPGIYDFYVSVEKQTKMTKSPNYYYSEKLNKLFAKRDVPCPFLFRTVNPPPPGSVVKVTPIFGSPEHVNEVVKRCPTHMAGSQNEPRSQVKHLLTSDHREARHVEDPVTKRLYVVIPYEEPQVGSTWSTCLIQFNCLNSCFKSSSKRPLDFIFTLEHKDKVIGRQVIKARLCACPGRDLDIEVNRLNCDPEKRKRSAPTNHQQRSKVRRVQKDIADIRSEGSSGPGIGADAVEALRDEVTYDDAGNEVFELKVRGRANFELLLRVRDSLHLAACLPSDLLQKYSGIETCVNINNSNGIPCSNNNNNNYDDDDGAQSRCLKS